MLCPIEIKMYFTQLPTSHMAAPDTQNNLNKQFAL